MCAELLPELITLDEWGYPLLAEGGVPAGLSRQARRAVRDCPALALLIAPIRSAPLHPAPAFIQRKRRSSPEGPRSQVRQGGSMMSVMERFRR